MLKVNITALWIYFTKQICFKGLFFKPSMVPVFLDLGGNLFHNFGPAMENASSLKFVFHFGIANKIPLLLRRTLLEF